MLCCACPIRRPEVVSLLLEAPPWLTAIIDCSKQMFASGGSSCNIKTFCKVIYKTQPRMKRMRCDDLIETPEELLETMRDLNEDFEIFNMNKFCVSEKNKTLSVTYALSTYDAIQDLISADDYAKVLSLLEETCMNVCKYTVDCGRCHASTIRVDHADKVRTIYYPFSE